MGSVTIRPYVARDRAAVLDLAPRLAEGVAAWRDPEAVAAQVVDWVRTSLDEHDTDGHLMLVAMAESDDELVGFASAVRRHHWSGSQDAYIGELVVGSGSEGLGVGRRLVEAVTQWAHDEGLSAVTLETGAANARARGFYAALGFAEEDVRLALPLT
ncbi:MAG: GNAT family N-acetyltransferase [Nocardioidaceae bacterium]|jgi:GNAT superfamily N-acetyltransferase|nr:GNAT family N-acetyltransferase [Nocardioidaceae bacterium]